MKPQIIYFQTDMIEAKIIDIGDHLTTESDPRENQITLFQDHKLYKMTIEEIEP